LDYTTNNTVDAVRNYWDLGAGMVAAYGFAVGNNELFFAGTALSIFRGVGNPFTNDSISRLARNLYGELGTYFTLLLSQNSSAFEEMMGTFAVGFSALAVATLENDRRENVERQRLEDLIIHPN